MWTADRWKDYEVIDCSSGEKLERWGKWLLVRPDPQVIWATPKENRGWQTPAGRYHRSSRGGGEWEFHGLPKEWEISYELAVRGGCASESREAEPADPARGFSDPAPVQSRGTAPRSEGRRLTFRLKPFSFKHTGLFPEQAANWDWFSGLIQDAVKSGREVKVLNLFAYTGGATIAAAAAGAAVTHVDASRGMVLWAKENAQISGIEDAPIRWLVDDCVKFVRREIRRGSRYDAIIMDPPSYGRGPKGEIWKIEDAVYPLVKDCTELLSDDPLFFLMNSYTTGLQASVLSYLLGSLVVPEKGGRVEADEIGLPVTESRLILPCGAAGRWVK